MVGGLFAGIGGLELGAERALGARTAWQVDLVGAAIRERRFSGALQVEGNARAVDVAALPWVDVLCAGFACQDLSTAGKRAGLHEGERTGVTWRETLRFLGILRPDLVVLENVPALLTKHKADVDEALSVLGYGCTWVRAAAADVGAPHLRRRVFVIGVRGAPSGRVVELHAAPPKSEAQGRLWPTPTAGDAKASGSRCLPGSGAHTGTSLTDAVRGDRATVERPWATPMAAEAKQAKTQGPGRESLTEQARPWATPSARDYRVGSGLDRGGSPPLSEQAAPTGGRGRRLNPDWVEALMGLPVGWTDPSRLVEPWDGRWPRGRYPEDWDRSQVWPGYDWEPPRTLPDGPPVRGRADRLRALGNAVVPAQAAAAIRLALGR